MCAPGRAMTSKVGFGMNSVMVSRTTSFLRPLISTKRKRSRWVSGRCRVSASSASYRWLSASKTGASESMDRLYSDRVKSSRLFRGSRSCARGSRRVPLSSTEWSLPAVHDVLAATVPDREMLVCGPTRRTFAEVAARTRSVAAFLGAAGLGVRRERDQLGRWECGQDTVALVLRNCPEYVETMLACYRARAVPFNVNHHYTPPEVGALFATVPPRGVIYHRSLGPLVGEALAGGSAPRVLVDVDDGSGVEPLPGSVRFETAAATPAGQLPTPSPDDLYMVCTGGTTGLPKAVLWRQADIFVAAMSGRDDLSAEALAETAADGRGVWFPTAPLMHAAAQWTVFSGFHGGGTVV